MPALPFTKIRVLQILSYKPTRPKPSQNESSADTTGATVKYSRNGVAFETIIHRSQQRNILWHSVSKFIFSYYASTAFPPRLAPPLKRPRLMPPARSQHPKQQKQQPAANTTTVPDLNQLKVYSKYHRSTFWHIDETVIKVGNGEKERKNKKCFD